MLAESDVGRIRERMMEAEIRSMYFGDLASRYTRYKQILSGASFFLSSGAAAALIGEAPKWVPVALAIVSALASAYSMAVNLDRRANTMAKLQHEWNTLQAGYERLQSHWQESAAEETLEELINRAAVASELAATEAPNDGKLVAKWANWVYSRYQNQSTTA